MRSFSRIILPLIVTILAISGIASVFTISASAFESAKALYNEGRKAEARQDYIAAFEAFYKAYQQKPEDLKYRVAFQRTRFLASAAHVNKGQDLRQEGKLPEALQEFEYAAKIDPSSFVALQEVKRTKALLNATENSPGGPQKVVPEQSPITRRIEEASGPVELSPVSTQPITLEISNSSNVVYETLGRLAGINVLFDPDYTPRRITLKLNGVSLRESLDIVAFHSNTFWRPVTSNTIYVAANTPAKRKELEQNVLKTFYLSNVSAATDLQEVSNALRSILEIQKVQQVNSQNAIIVRGTPDQVALAEKIIGDIDRAKPEVIVEVAIMQVRRDKIRDLGITPPASVSAAIVPFSGTSTTTGTTTAGTTTTGTTTTNTTTTNPTLNTLAHITDRDISVTIPGATANFLLNDSNSRLLQNPQIRASDGQKASLKIGDRIPIATGSFGGGFAGGGIGGANGLVNTQFQYIDVGVNIDITPRVYSDREVGLKLSLDVSSVTGSSTIGGVTQPIISQRKIEHDIRLKEGEANLLGGIFEDTDTNAISGIPGLAQIPFLKYFFSSTHKERVENELVFILVPHIVREHELTELNQRAIDVGTGNQLDLRPMRAPAGGSPLVPAPQSSVPMSAPPSSTVSANGSPVTPAQVQQAGAGSLSAAGAAQNPATPSRQGSAQAITPANAGSTAANGVAAPGTAAAVRFDPPMVTPSVGSTFNVNVVVSNVKDLYSAPMQIIYDPNVLQLMGINNGDMLSRDGQAVALVHREDVATGTIQANATRPPSSGGISGDGVVYTLTFQAKQKGNATLAIARPSVRNSSMQSIPLVATPGTVSVGP